MSKIEQRILAIVVVALLGLIVYQQSKIFSELEEIDLTLTGTQIEIERLRLKD